MVVAGVSGRLGGAVVARAAELGYPIAAGLRAGSASGREGGTGPTRRTAYPIRGPDALPELLRLADVFVSATNAEAERANLPAVAASGVPAVVATTGLTGSAADALAAAARTVPIVQDANFSIGARLLARAVGSLGRLPEGFDVSIVESHRREKPDHPSGTAQALADRLGTAGATGWEGARGRRTPGLIEIASLRGGETPGVHTVQVMGPLELLRFEHIAYGRDAFADGVLAAARWLHRHRGALAPGIYDLDDVLGGS